MDSSELSLLADNANNSKNKVDYCRVCGVICSDDSYKHIYETDGIFINLADKINRHLPINVSKCDLESLICCENCINIIELFSDLYNKCLDSSSANEPTNFESLKINKEETTLLDSYPDDDDDDENLELTEKNIDFIFPELSCKEQFSCKICQEFFTSPEKLENHLQSHKTISKSPSPIKEKLETTAANSKTTTKHEKKSDKSRKKEYLNTIKLKINGRIYYNCKICNKKLSSHCSFRRHSLIHTGERPYICYVCGKSFRSVQGVTRHVKETHELVKKFACDICQRKFSTRRNVQQHRYTHTNERLYVCNLCGKSFNQRASLFMHNKSHSDTFSHVCSFCNHGFRTVTKLNQHLTIHTGEKPFACDVCGRRFRVSYEMKRHKMVHSNEKPFSCAECECTFRQKRYLRNHLKQKHNKDTSD